jgi:ABC-type lipoprotein release transport system permease subunit
MMSLKSIQIWSFMAGRFILRHRRKTIATASFIILGTGILVFLHALTVGINDTMVLNTTRLHYGDLFLEFPDGMEQPESVANALAFEKDIGAVLFRRKFSGLLLTPSAAAPVVLFGVHPKTESAETAISRRLIAGSYPEGSRRQILLGKTVAEKLKATVGGVVTFMESSGVRLGDYTVSGIYETEIQHFDTMIVYAPLMSVDPSICARNPAEAAIFLTKATSLDDVKARIEKTLPPGVTIRTWAELMPDLIQLIEMNEVAMGILMLFIFILVGFGISNSFVLTIVERFREFGILKAMGVTPGELIGLVFLESFMVCLGATLLGLAAGWGLSHLIAYGGIDFSGLTSHNRYFIVSGLVRPRTTLEGIYWPGILSLAASIVSSYFPTRIAAVKVTSETLRFA